MGLKRTDDGWHSWHYGYYGRNWQGSNGMQYLPENEKEAVNHFATLIRFRLGNNLTRMELFGSKARGDFDSESDIDLLLIVKRRDSVVREDVSEIVAEMNLEHDCVLSPVILTEKEFGRNRESDTLFFKNVAAEGVPL